MDVADRVTANQAARPYSRLFDVGNKKRFAVHGGFFLGPGERGVGVRLGVSTPVSGVGARDIYRFWYNTHTVSA